MSSTKTGSASGPAKQAAAAGGIPTWLMVALWFTTTAVCSTLSKSAFLTSSKATMLDAGHARPDAKRAASLGLLVFQFGGAMPCAFIAAALSAKGGVSSVFGSLKRLVPAYLEASVLLLLANGLNTVGLQAAGVTVTYVLKSLIPLFTLLTRFFFHGERFEARVIAALGLTVLGVCVAVAGAKGVGGASLAVTELLAPLGSAIAQTALNMRSKAAQQRTGADASMALLAMMITCSAITVPCFVLTGHASSLATAATQSGAAASLGAISLAAAAAYYSEYGLNFALIARVSPVTFSIADIARRAATIMFGAVVVDQNVTANKAVGVGLAFCGAAWYSRLSSAASAKAASESGGKKV